MEALLDLLTILTFFGALCAFYGLMGLSKRRQRAALCEQRLAQLKRTVGATDDAEIDSILRELQSAPLAGVPLLGDWARRIWLSINILGWRRTLTLRLTLIALAGILFGIAFGSKTPAPILCSALLSVVGALALFFALLRHALGKQHKILQQNLPEAIDAINRACRAGVPITNAFILVAEHLKGPLSTELRIIDHWLRLGVPLRRVMQDSAERVPLPEYRFFAVILIINQESGGRLGETLERLSKTLRDRQELQMKIMAKTSEARASAKIVAALAPGMMLYMYFNAPSDFYFLLNDPAGVKVTIYIVASVILGLAIIQIMVRRVR